MEEILASIRRIISEDDQPPAPEAHAAPAAVAHPEPTPAAFHEEPISHDEDDVLELNEPAPEPTETHGDLEVYEPPAAAAPPPPPPPARDPEPAPRFVAYEADEPEGGGLVSDHAASAAASHFGALSQSISMPTPGRSLEDLVREMMRPLLKDWLDQHLPSVVEQVVRDEVERVSRRRV